MYQYIIKAARSTRHLTLLLCIFAPSCDAGDDGDENLDSTAQLRDGTEIWHIKEAGGWTGTWILQDQLPDGLEVFSVWQKYGNTELSAKAHVIRKGGIFAARKFDVSDGNTCHYFGTLNGRNVTATYLCKGGGEWVFHATID